MSLTVPVISYDPVVFAHCGSLTVHAVFRHAWHLRTRNGEILSVVDARWNGPLTVRVSTIPPGREICPDTAATLTESVLTIGTITARFETAHVWKAMPAGGEPIQWLRMRDDLAAMRQQIRTAGRGGLEVHLDGCILASGNLTGGSATRGDATTVSAGWMARGLAEMDALGKALGRVDLDAVSLHAAGLLGLGPGLTPSGDDVLCGLMAGLQMLGRRSSIHQDRCDTAVAALAACSHANASRRTTSLSATLLRSAARGVVAEPLLQLLRTVGSELQIETVDDVLMLGHSSGSDMLTGALMACSALVRWEEVFGSTVVDSAQHLSRLHQIDANLRSIECPGGGNTCGCDDGDALEPGTLGRRRTATGGC